ncbi:hypothetical protein ACMFMF_002865 [Clarireedia jacksonii]
MKVWLIGMGICLIDGGHNGAFGSPTPAPPSDLSPEDAEFYTDPSIIFGQKISAVIIFLWALTFIFFIIFDCGTAIWANWASTTAKLKYCNIGFKSEYGLAYGLAISDVLIDIYVFLLPLPFVSTLKFCSTVDIVDLTLWYQIWRLQLSTKKKFAISGIFLLGAS